MSKKITKLTLEHRKKKYKLNVDGQDVHVEVWEQGFKGEKAFEGGWTLIKDKDKKWFKGLNEKDKKEFTEFVKTLEA